MSEYSDSDYEYEGSDDGYESSDHGSECESKEPDVVITTVIPPGTKQYQWVVLCHKLQCLYGKDECEYEGGLSITFKIEERSFRMYVVDIDNIGSQYPFEPPLVEYTGKPINLMDRLSISQHYALNKRRWNICTNMFNFVKGAMDVLRFTQDAYGDNTVYRELLSISNKIELGVGFELDDLPSFGVLTIGKKSSQSSYSWSGTNGQSLVATISASIHNILGNIKLVKEDCGYKELLKRVLTEVMSAKISKLELIANQSFYDDVVKIVRECEYEIDVSDLEESEDECEQSDRVLFVESIPTNHTTGTISKQFTKRVFAEIDTLRDALKDFEGYLAVSEQNISVMKLLLIPDYDTPYGGGYFEFEIFIPANYPNSPPIVKFLTTGGGKVRFNPNLYNCGKVCLSVLNTWNANQWDSKSSTITQVVLSIQSMIFIEHPYTNEPAYYNALETPKGRALSEAYSANIVKQTARVAIMEQIANKNTPFAEIIKRHWAENKAKAVEAYGLKI